LNQAAWFALESLKHQGSRVFLDWIKVAWAAAVRDAKIEDFRSYELRQPSATRLGDAGTDAFTIAAILGHSSIQMSARYTHATDERNAALLKTCRGARSPVTQLEAAG
jgi:integrase